MGWRDSMAERKERRSRVMINRAPVLTLWAAVVAEMVGPIFPPTRFFEKSTHSTPRSKAWGMLRVDTERRFLLRFKNRGLAPSNVSIFSQSDSFTCDNRIMDTLIEK
jgi:hypothetical protein